METKKAVAGITVAALLSFAGAAMAHELFLKPEVFAAKGDSDVKVSIISTHRFMISEEVEEADTMKLGVLGISGDTFGDVKADEANQCLVSTLHVKSDAPAVLTLERAGELYSITNKGGKPGSRKELEAQGLKVKSSTLYCKFVKAMFNAKSGDETWKELANQDLEIVPLSNPADLKVGDELAVKILHHGSPESTNVWASYDGFAPDWENTYAYYTECDTEGVAHIRITHPGYWFVRTMSTEKGVDGEYDSKNIRSVFCFEVK